MGRKPYGRGDKWNVFSDSSGDSSGQIRTHLEAAPVRKIYILNLGRKGEDREIFSCVCCFLAALSSK